MQKRLVSGHADILAAVNYLSSTLQCKVDALFRDRNSSDPEADMLLGNKAAIISDSNVLPVHVYQAALFGYRPARAFQRMTTRSLNISKLSRNT